MGRRSLAVIVLVAAVLGGAAFAVRWPVQSGWREIAWPFPRDAWPAGRAFRCEGAGCGAGLEAYVRPKIGFCNCTTGVSGDAEVDGVADLDMISDDFVPTAAGIPVTVGGMAGRTRTYVLRTRDGRDHPAAGLAISSKCDLVVAASLGPDAGSEQGRLAVARLMETPAVLTWLHSLLGRG